MRAESWLKTRLAPTSEAPPLTYIPMAALVEGDGDRASVFVIDAGKEPATASKRDVRVAFITADSIALESGLSSGETVITKSFCHQCPARCGIDVYTTVNIQHVESLNDVVVKITRVRVRETVPDSIVDRADEIAIIASDRVVVIDADGSVEEVHQRVMEAVCQRAPDVD